MTISSKLQTLIFANCFGFLAYCGTSFAEPLTIAVEDKNWSPYYVWVDGKPTGPCPEIAAGTFDMMGVPFEFSRHSWAKALRSVERQQVDGALCATRSAERDAFAYYPVEPLLLYEVTLFVAADSPLETSDDIFAEGLRFAIMKDYAFGGLDQLLVDSGLVRLEAKNRDSLFNLLISGRVDAVLDSRLPSLEDIERLGLEDKLRPLLPSLSEQPGYVMFSRRDNHDTLANDFSEALIKFKKTALYGEIAAKYDLN